MKILFICGSLEPGRDGVGDYTLRLAGECIRRGHDCAAIALNDKAAEAAFFVPRSKFFVEHLRRSPVLGVLRSLSTRKVDPESETTKNQEQGTKNLYSTQLADGTPVPVLRLPATMPWGERMRVAGACVADFDPDWISLQYVPYAFHAKGLPFLLPGRIKRLLEVASRPPSPQGLPLSQSCFCRTRWLESEDKGGQSGGQGITHQGQVTKNQEPPATPKSNDNGGASFNLQPSAAPQPPTPSPPRGTARRLHVMFHELWVGMGTKAPLKQRIVGWFQKMLICHLKLIGIQRCHTQGVPYVDNLRSMGLSPLRLPLFGNIPIVPMVNGQGDSTETQVGLFGSIHPDWDLQRGTKVLKDFLLQQGLPKCVRAIGNMGPAFPSFVEQMKLLNISVESTGPLPAQEVAAEFSNLRLAVSTYWPDLSQKSSAIAALNEHGIPVLLLGDCIWGQKYENLINDSTPLVFTPGSLGKNAMPERGPLITDSLLRITQQFLEDLSSAVPGN